MALTYIIRSLTRNPSKIKASIDLFSFCETKNEKK